MKYAIYGAGAIGAFLGARLMTAGEEVALLARGPHLAAIKQGGLRIRSTVFGEWQCRPRATDEPAAIGPVDVVVLAVKAQALPAVARRLGPLLGAATQVVGIQNGIPWWYFRGLGGRWEGLHLKAVDPGGVIASQIDVRRVIGCIAYCSASISEPGVVEHVEGVRFPLGELDGSRSERLKTLARSFKKAGLKAPMLSHLRHDIWVKLLGNATFNPISALTGATLRQMAEFPPTRELVHSMMEEMRAVAAAFGVEIELSAERRIAGAQKVGHHKTSMLQDLEAGRSAELEPLLGAVIELASKAGVAVPHLSAVYACSKLLFAKRSEPR